MALNDVSLTAGMRANLGALQSTANLLDRTQNRLATGKKVNTALDNPTNFFAAQSHTQRATDLTARKDGMAEAIQGVRAADKGITGVTTLIEAAKGLAQSARSADAAGRENLAAQFNTIRTQIDQLAKDSIYKGKNFLDGDTLNVLFNENGSSLLTINGFDSSASGLTITEVRLNSGVSTTTAAGAGALTGDGTTTTVPTIETATIAGTITGTVDIQTVTHTAVLASGVAGAIATSTYFAGAPTTLAVSGSGQNVTLDFSGLTTGGTNLSSDSVTINAVYINGVALTGADLATVQANLTGATAASGSINTGLFSGVTASASLVTGASVSFDLTIDAHTAAGAPVAANLVAFDLAAGDVMTGLSGAGLSGNIATGGDLTTLNVFVDGTYAATGSYSIVGQQIIFTGNAVPPSGTVTYTYNSGLVDGFRSQDVVTTLTGGTAGLIVLVSGTELSGGQYTISGNTITLANNLTGAVTLGLTGGAAGTTGVTTAAVSATVTGTSTVVNTGVFTVSETLLTGSVSQVVVNVSVNGVDATGNYTVSGNDITFNPGSEPVTGDQITYEIQTTSGIVAGAWSTDSGIDTSVDQLNTAIGILRTQSATLASSLNVVATRQDFTAGMVNELLKGADNLTLADMNEEGANMLMLQTRQQLSTTALKMSSDAAQAVLRLF